MRSLLQILNLYTRCCACIINPLCKKLEKKLKNIYFRKYNKPIEKDRYIELHSNSTNGVNHLNHNTQQGIKPYTLENKYEKWLVNVSDILSRHMSLTL